MDKNSPIPALEKEYIRELAKKQLEYAKLPVMSERKRLWYLHNRSQGERPMVVMEESTFINDILPPRRCEHPVTAGMERQFSQQIAAHETFDDDKVIPDYFYVFHSIHMNILGQKQKRTRAAKGPGMHIDPLFETLEEGLPLLRPSEFACHAEESESYAKAAEDVLGDIMQVVTKDGSNCWSSSPTGHIIGIMGMENMYFSLMAEPDNFHTLMRLMTDDILRFLRWQEENSLLSLNNGNDYMGAGSYCFSDELPQADFAGRVRPKDTWGHLNSQESIGISPKQFEEFIYPYYEMIAKEFGLIYYGCCEPVHAFWDKSLSRLPNLRKISISPWCDEEFMGERLAGGRIIYSRKPSPIFLGVEAGFDEEAFTKHIRKTAAAVKGKCKAEIIFRDIISLHGNIEKTRRAVEITRNIMEDIY